MTLIVIAPLFGVLGYWIGYGRALRDNANAIAFYRQDAIRRYAGQRGLVVKSYGEPIAPLPL